MVSNIDVVKSKMEKVLEQMGFERLYFGETKLYKNNRTGWYHCITYANGLKSYIIESAENYAEAQKNLFEDSDLYPASLGQDAILAKFREDLIKYY